MSKVVINVYMFDNTYFKTPSLLEFEVDEIDGWREEVACKVNNIFTPSSKYFLSYHYKTVA
jgi:hypothetical protein